MKRRTFLGAALSAPMIARAESQRVLRFIPQADVSALDPVWTAAYVTRHHGYLIFDTLYGQATDYSIHPQMVEGHVIERDGRLWRLTLRNGLLFHDGTPVLARDCVASIRRWSRRDPFGQALLAVTDELSAPDDRTIQFQLKRPFAYLPEALGKMPSNIMPIMPERLAVTDPFKQITEMVGSGPFRFLADQRVSGSRAVYERFAAYRPRESGTPDGTAGPKIAHFDQVVWNVIPDAATAAAAMQQGEADWWENPIFDLVPSLQASKDLKVSVMDPTGNVATLLLNHELPPFSNAAIRRALLLALDQADIMAAVVGDVPDAARGDVGYFPPDTPMATDAGMDALKTKRDPDAAKRAILAAGYTGEKVVVMAPSDYQQVNAITLVAADLMQRCGLNVDLQTSDWGTLLQRRTSRAPLDQGGWSAFVTTFHGADQANPLVHQALRANGNNAFSGWPDSPELERLRAQWIDAPDPAAQRAIAAQIQLQAFVDVPYLPLGQFFQRTVRSASLVDALTGMPLFWNIRRA